MVYGTIILPVFCVGVKLGLSSLFVKYVTSENVFVTELFLDLSLILGPFYDN
jgi:hypothetical protein